jgi:phage terminase small subunit
MDGQNLPPDDQPPRKRRGEGWNGKTPSPLWDNPNKGPRPLNKRQQLFVVEYLKDYNATGAAKRAGYSNKCATAVATQLLKHPAIKEEVDRIQAEQLKDIGMTAREVLLEIVKMARFNIQDYTTLDQDGMLVPDFSQATREQLAAIASVETEVYTEGRGEEARTVKRMKFKPWSKEAALKHLLVHYGLAIEKHDLTNSDGTLRPAPMVVQFMDAPEDKGE